MFIKSEKSGLLLELVCKFFCRQGRILRERALKLYFIDCANKSVFGAGSFNELPAQRNYFLSLVEFLQMSQQAFSLSQLSI
jgi:hypothetical protein